MKRVFVLLSLLLVVGLAACDIKEIHPMPPVSSNVDSGASESPASSSTETGSNALTPNESAPPVASSSSEQISLPTSSNETAVGEIDRAKAKEIALNHAGLKSDDIIAYHIEEDYAKGGLFYEIEFVSGTDKYEYDISAKTGKISIAEKNGNRILAGTYKKISEAAAKEIAFLHAGVAEKDITNYKIEFDVDDGVPSYEIEFRSGGFEYEYDIHSSDGKILKSEKEID